MRDWFRLTAATAVLLALPMTVGAAAPPSVAQAPQSAEDARLTAFLDAEFAQELKLRPQLATRLGIKDGEDRLDDISDAGLLKRLEWRRASVARMKNQFDRGKLSPQGQANYDIWAIELDRAELSYQFSPLPAAVLLVPLLGPFRAAELPDQHAYRPGCGRHAGLQRPIARNPARFSKRRSRKAGNPMRPACALRNFEIDRVIAGSNAIITGAPFAAGSQLSVMGRRQGQGRQASDPPARSPPSEADALLADARNSACFRSTPPTERVIAWAQSELSRAPAGRVGAISLPGRR